MSGERPLRLFVAAYPGPELADGLVAQVRALQLRGLNPCAPEQVHLTLHFIGDTDPRQLDEVIDSVRRAAAGLAPASVGVLGLFSLPEQGRARLVAAALEPHPTLTKLRCRLVTRLARRAWGREAFLPHLTLGRFASGSGEPIKTPARGQLEITEIVLVRSVLRQEGAEHRVVARVALG